VRVLMLNIDGLQPAYIGPYGCEWSPTPTLDGWAASGVVFDQHYADCPEANDESWRTGRHPLAPARVVTDLLADLRAANVRAARVGSPVSTDGWDFELAVERASNPLRITPYRSAARDAVDKLGDPAAALLCVEIDALLPPWRPSAEAIVDCFADEDFEPWIDELPERLTADDDTTFRRLQTTYAAALATLDAFLGKLLADLGRCGWGEQAVWILTAHRGFPLGEHGPVGFAVAGLNEELVHLPLLIRMPGDQYAGQRVSTMTQPIDLAPTLRQLFGVPLTAEDEPWVGRSLVPLIGGGVQPVRDRAAIGLQREGRTLWGIRTPEWYLTFDDTADGERRLYVKTDDRWEVNDVRPRNLELAEEMEEDFRRLYLAPGH
jgi:arylsulfatase A-like enzyme